MKPVREGPRLCDLVYTGSIRKDLGLMTSRNRSLSLHWELWGMGEGGSFQCWDGLGGCPIGGPLGVYVCPNPSILTWDTCILLSVLSYKKLLVTTVRTRPLCLQSPASGGDTQLVNEKTEPPGKVAKQNSDLLYSPTLPPQARNHQKDRLVWISPSPTPTVLLFAHCRLIVHRF